VKEDESNDQDQTNGVRKNRNGNSDQ